MADIHIQREHRLGLATARKMAARWAEATVMTSASDPPQVGRIGGSRTPARKHAPDSTNKMPVAR